MNRRNYIFIALTALLLLVYAGQRMVAMAALGTEFAYRDTLINSAGAPVNGTFDFEFSLYDDLTAGSQIGITIAQTLDVNGGLFSTSLDFGADAFNGEERYLEIALRPIGGGGFTTLTPRRPILPIPYALYAEKVQPVGNVVVVAKSGGDFTTLGAALASITTASATNPYLIKIGPGVYQEQVDLKDYVHIEGSGEGVTILRGLGGNTHPNTDGSSATLRVTGALNAEVRWLTVESDGAGNDHAIAFWTDGTTETFRLSHVTATGFDGSDDNYGIFTKASSSMMNSITAVAFGGRHSHGVMNRSSSPTMVNVVASASGSTNDTRGVYNLDSAAILENVTASASGGLRNFGVVNSNDTSRMNNVTATAFGGDVSYAVFNEISAATMHNIIAISEGSVVSVGINNSISSSTTMHNVTVTASGGVDGYGISNHDSSPKMTDVSITAYGGGSTNGVYNNNASPKMENVTIDAIGAFIINYGVINVNDSAPTMNDVTVTTFGVSSYGVYNDGSSSAIRDSAIAGALDSIHNVNGGSAQIANTMLGGTLFGVGTFTCVNNYDASFAPIVACP
ncbi:MAG: pectinesterase family protein [Chloroflexota bacterium]